MPTLLPTLWNFLGSSVWSLAPSTMVPWGPSTMVPWPWCLGIMVFWHVICFILAFHAFCSTLVQASTLVCSTLCARCAMARSKYRHVRTAKTMLNNIKTPGGKKHAMKMTKAPMKKAPTKQESPVGGKRMSSKTPSEPATPVKKSPGALKQSPDHEPDEDEENMIGVAAPVKPKSWDGKKPRTAAKSKAEKLGQARKSQGDLARWCNYQIANNTENKRNAIDLLSDYEKCKAKGSSVSQAFAIKFSQSKPTKNFGWSKSFAEDYSREATDASTTKYGYMTPLSP